MHMRHCGHFSMAVDVLAIDFLELSELLKAEQWQGSYSSQDLYCRGDHCHDIHTEYREDINTVSSHITPLQ